MDIGVHRRIILHQLIQHDLGFLSRCGVVQVNQRFTMDLRLEDRELRPNRQRIQARERLNGRDARMTHGGRQLLRERRGKKGIVTPELVVCR
jgi:hypothetical protein